MEKSLQDMRLRGVNQLHRVSQHISTYQIINLSTLLCRMGRACLCPTKTHYLVFNCFIFVSFGKSLICLIGRNIAFIKSIFPGSYCHLHYYKQLKLQLATTNKSGKIRIYLYVLLTIAGCVFAYSSIIPNDYIKLVVVMGTLCVGLYGIMKGLSSTGTSSEEEVLEKNNKIQQLSNPKK